FAGHDWLVAFHYQAHQVFHASVIEINIQRDMPSGHFVGLGNGSGSGEIRIQKMRLYWMQDGVAVGAVHSCAESCVERNRMIAAIDDKIWSVGFSHHFDHLQNSTKLPSR